MAELHNEILFINELINKGIIDQNLTSKYIGVDFSPRKPKSKDVEGLLSSASKNLTGSVGYPDYIIEDIENDLIIVIENKEEIKNHYSSDFEKNKNDSSKLKKYAVDGALFYASKLKDKYNVIAIGCSGRTKQEMKVSTFVWKKGSDRWSNTNDDTILNYANYKNLISGSLSSSTSGEVINELTTISKEINEGMRNYLGTAESQRYYLIASILIALDNSNFRIHYSNIRSSKELLKFIFDTAKDSFSDMKYESHLVDKIRFIKNIADKSKKTEYPFGYIKKIISTLDNKVFLHYKESNIDVLSYFFTLFLQYSTSGGAEMGIVLTPPHITNLFSRLAGVNVKSKILDLCLGTGGFLSAAWKHVYNSDVSEIEKESFRHNNLWGVEFNPDIYPAAILNMLINKDGKSNIEQGDSFELAKQDKIKKFQADIGMINPPYSDEVKSEIEFVELMLDNLQKGGTGIAIIPVNAVSRRTKKHSESVVLATKERILKKHKLLASIQMPSNLFYPKGTETIILIFESWKPNKGSKTWFRKFDDGYELIKQSKARTATEISENCIDELVESYNLRRTYNGEFLKEIVSEDQWVYTVLRENNYVLNKDDLKEKAKEYAIFELLNKND